MVGSGSDGVSADRHEVRDRPAWTWGLGIALWLAAVLAGFGSLLNYKAIAGAPAKAGRSWPSAAGIARSTTGPTLVMFAHPHCPCTRATVSELARLVSRHPEVSTRVLFLRPEGFEEGWEKTDLWTTVAGIPGAVPIADDSGAISVRFGALTSGQVMLFDSNGRLLFSGGLTSSRGHEGESVGQRRIHELLTTGTTDRPDSPVYGCALGLEENPAKQNGETDANR